MYHWNKEYSKLHPLVVCYLRLDGSLQHNSATYDEYKETLTDFIDDLTRHSISQS